MRKYLLILIITFLFSISLNGQRKAASDSCNYIQIGLLLDASSSMEGLLAQAQDQIWNLYHFMEDFRRDSLATIVEFGLFSYGHTGFDDTHHINFISDFSSNLDSITDNLFLIEINGGEEYCGKVIQDAMDLLSWRNEDNFKCIFIAGNEPFDQGEFDYEKACRTAASRNININTIFCGEKEKGIEQLWRDGAILGAGAYAHINSNKKDTLKTPYDGKLLRNFKAFLSTYPGENQEELESKYGTYKKDIDIPPVYRDIVIYRYKRLNKAKDAIDLFYENNWQLTPEIKDQLPTAWQNWEEQKLKRHLFILADKRDVHRQSMQMYIQKFEEFKRISQGPQEEDNSLDEAIKEIITEQLTNFGFTKR